MRILDEQLSKFVGNFLFFDVGGKSLTKYQHRNAGTLPFSSFAKIKSSLENTPAIAQIPEILLKVNWKDGAKNYTLFS